MISSSQSVSGGSRPPRYRSLAYLYFETNPITPNDQTCLLVDEEPLSYSEATEDELWRQAMSEEMLAIDQSHT